MKNFPKATSAFITLAVACVLIAWTVRVSGADTPKPTVSAQEVHIDNFSFQSQSLTVPVGAQVTWVNRDDIPHTVVSEDQLFKSKALDTDEKFTYTFTKPGTYKYFCSIHPKMTAEIVVK